MAVKECGFHQPLHLQRLRRLRRPGVQVGYVRLRPHDVELEALNGKCSPCRALPVGSNLEASLVVETVTQQLDPVTDTVVTVVEKVIDQTKLLTLSDNTELELSFVPVIQNGQIVAQDLETEILIAGTCGVN